MENALRKKFFFLSNFSTCHWYVIAEVKFAHAFSSRQRTFADVDSLRTKRRANGPVESVVRIKHHAGDAADHARHAPCRHTSLTICLHPVACCMTVHLYPVYTIKQLSSKHRANIEKLEHTSCTCILNAFAECLLHDCSIFAWSCKRGISIQPWALEQGEQRKQLLPQLLARESRP